MSSPTTAAERSRRYRERHPEEARTYSREYRRNWRAENPDRAREASRKSEKKRDAEKRRKRRAVWREKNQDEINRKQRERYARAGRSRDAVLETNAARRAKTRKRVEREAIYRSTNGMCGICGCGVSYEEFHMDHILPLAKGGLHVESNLQPAHASCNLRKGARV